MVDLNQEADLGMREKLAGLELLEKNSDKQLKSLFKLRDQLISLKELGELIKSYKKNEKSSALKDKSRQQDDKKALKKPMSANVTNKIVSSMRQKTGVALPNTREVKIKETGNKIEAKESLKRPDNARPPIASTTRMRRTLTNVGSFKGFAPKDTIRMSMKRRPTVTQQQSKAAEKEVSLHCEIGENKQQPGDPLNEKPTAVQDTIDPTRLFQCDFDAIDHTYNKSAEFHYSLDDIDVVGGLDNYDKMFFKELLEQSEESEPSALHIEDLMPAGQAQSKIFKTFLDYRDDKNKYFYNKQFSKILVRELIKSLEAKMAKIDQMKYAYVKKFGVLDLQHRTDFEYSFFSNFYLTTLEEEYNKIQSSFQPNSVLSDLLNIFKALTDCSEDLPGIIKVLKAYKRQEIPTKTKIKVEGMANNDLNLFDPNASFKYNNITGYLCHVIRDIVFYYGIVSNINFVLSEHYNTENYYRFLIEKRKFYSRRAKRLNHIIN